MSNLTRPYNLQDPKQATRFLLQCLIGFEDSSLFESYQEYEGFTDDEWDTMKVTLWKWATDEQRCIE